MEKKAKFEELFSGASKAAKKLYENAVLAADQNDDGKFDLSDVSAIAEAVGENMKKGTQAMKATAEEKARQMELKTLQPIFTETLDSADFSMPKFIRVVERDKKRAESEVCQGAIGYGSDQKGLHIVNIYRDSVSAFKLSFAPNCDSDFYYIDPTDSTRYIALNDYFNALKIARVLELQSIAQDLGAKYFKVTYVEEQTTFVETKAKAHAKTPVGTADVDHAHTEKRYQDIKIEAENNFAGKAPIMPHLQYLKNDPSILSLVSMRLNATSPLLAQKFMIDFSSSCGLKEADAVKIDAVLKGLKISGNTTVAHEVKNESRRYFRYEIEF